MLRAEVTDSAFNVGSAQRTITLTSLVDSRLPTTLRDFDAPGTQPLEASTYGGSCASCHANFDRASEPDFPWRGSMMAHSGRDPLFDASLAIAEQDAGGSGDLCFRCHDPAVWMNGRAVPSDGSQLYDWERTGVGCVMCHTMVDPVFTHGESPVEDLDVLARLSDPPSVPGNGSYVVDPYGMLRGPFEDTACAHFRLVSPFHQEAEMCASCHDQSNPLYEADGSGHFVPGAFDQRASSFEPGELMPVDRTFSEWLHSDFNTPEGVYAPEFGGNRERVSTCQDCHLHDVTGAACYYFGVPVRDDQPFHDLTGGNTWMPRVLAALDRYGYERDALNAAIERARTMLQNAAELKARVEGDALEVTVTNKTGHRLPGGYPLGRRMWLNVRFFDSADALVGESGHYDFDTGVLSEDAGLKVYRIVSGISDEVATLTGLANGPTLHGVLNNEILADNRIPPRGFTNAAFASFGGAPVGASYADGQHWDVTRYPFPAGASRVTVTLFYQSTTKEYVEFLRDENRTDERGKRMYDLWAEHDRCPPEVMREVSLSLEGRARALTPAPAAPR